MDSSNQHQHRTSSVIAGPAVNISPQGQPVQNQNSAQNRQTTNQERLSSAAEPQAQNQRTTSVSGNDVTRSDGARSAPTRSTAPTGADDNQAARVDKSERPKKTDKSEKKDKTEAVVTITAKEDFENILKTAGDKYIMVEFFATWCGPCRMLSVKLEELANLYMDKAIIVKIDVDDFEDIAMEYNVTSMPAFMIMKNKQKVEHFVGSKAEQLENALEKFVGKPT